MFYDLPKKVDVAGKEFEIRYDYRVILDIFSALNDPDLSAQEKATAVIQMFYLDYEALPDYQEAIKKCFEFINVGQKETGQKQPKLIEWDFDFPIIVGPVNRVLGYEIRAVPYDIKTNTGGVHWHTFMSAFNEIGGDCTFANVVAIRDKMNRGKKLEKHEKEFYRRNKDIIDLKSKYSSAEKDLLARLT